MANVKRTSTFDILNLRLEDYNLVVMLLRNQLEALEKLNNTTPYIIKMKNDCKRLLMELGD